MRVAIIADDLTGLNAIASEFERYGMRVATCLSTAALPQLAGFDVVGLDTNTRGMDAGTAAAIVEEAGRIVAAMNPDWIFKQNDSALHGHIVAELQAVLAGTEQDRMIFCPASPSAGRRTRNGRHSISAGGSEIDIARLWQSQGGDMADLTLVGQFKTGTRPGPGVSVADSASDADIDRVVAHAAASGQSLLGGSVGLARALARHLWVCDARSKPALLILGSFQGRTKAQAELFLSSLPAKVCDLPAAAGSREIGQAVEAVAEAFGGGRHAVLRPAPSAFSTGPDGYPLLDPATMDAIGQSMRTIGRQVLQRWHGDLSGVVIAGGSTSEIAAREILTLRAFRDVEYLDDGVAAALGEGHDGQVLPVVTKAGNWGGDDVLLRAVRWIQSKHDKMQTSALENGKHD